MKDLVYKNRFTDEDLRVEVEVRLRKLKENKYPYWSVTGTIKKGYGMDMEEISGAIGDRLIEYFPEIEPFERLHLAQGNGVPDYAVENGWYYKLTRNKKALKEILRLTDMEVERLMDAPDKDSFKYILHHDIKPRWNKEAEELFEKMRELTGDVLELDEGEELGPVVMTEDEVNAYKEKVASGYYNEKEIEKRECKKRSDETAEALNDILRTYNNRKDDAVKMRDLMQLLVNGGVPYPCMLEVYANKEVLIYVDQLKGIDSYYPEEEFDKLYEKLDKNDLIPEGFKVVKRKGF